MNRILPLLLCLAGPFLYAQYGTLDPTFGNDGFVITPLGMGNDLVITLLDIFTKGMIFRA